MNGYEMVALSALARNGKDYGQRIRNGQRFALVHKGQIFATIEPIEPRSTVYLPVSKGSK